MLGFIIGASVVIILFAIIISNIFVVQQSRAYVIERLGAFHAVQGSRRIPYRACPWRGCRLY